jgi:hypothetical protein
VTDEGSLTEVKRQQELEAMNAIFQVLNGLDGESRQRVFQTVTTYYQFALPTQQRTEAVSDNGRPAGPFSEDRSMSPKIFMMQKQPVTDVERVACLAYYLTHYRDSPHFKTLDISKLNTESAQPKFSNAAVAMENASKMGYLVPATKGNKQLSAAGELFVQKLPDREAAKAAMSSLRPRRKARKGASPGETLMDLSDSSDGEDKHSGR